MSKPKHIQLSIPHPCSENWDEMTPDAKGRHCAHCQKTVIDFTGWSDTALYNYFSKTTGEVCGRFTGPQLKRTINIPHQPHSRLYRLSIALGLTLTLSPALHTYAQNRPPWLPAQCAMPQRKQVQDCQPGLMPGELRGTIYDSKKEPLINTAVQLFRDGNLVGGAISDLDGNYSIKSLEPGSYDILVSYLRFDSVKISGICIENNKITRQNVQMSIMLVSEMVTGMLMYEDREPFLDLDNPTKRTYTREEIDRMPH